MASFRAKNEVFGWGNKFSQKRTNLVKIYFWETQEVHKRNLEEKLVF